ncbi:MAG: UDP-N-acetylmuramoyl-L-alanyl-D-glutamate--2,6-diaminopimelate ligase [Abditibacteriota bacterium]|nr:UDP-N-acetylmuramoyl-L-alanyl-D-glutamate--2,6-diaminopimelate ligase [Abditibacteriota bacterium]
MKLQELLSKIEYEMVAETDRDITSVAYDSRDVKEGALFAALDGCRTEGANFIDQAIENGAVCIVTETDVKLPDNVANVKVKNANSALGRIVSNFYGNPTEKMKVIGVTGTSGKTTVTNIIYNIYSNLNIKSGLVGTIANKIGDVVEPTNYTTPQAVDLQKLFYKMVENKVEVCVMEVSSHGLDQERVYGTEFDCGVFLNIARDHLDYHKTLESYKEAKLKLFSYYPKEQKKPFYAVVNYDEGLLRDVRKVFDGEIITFGRHYEADVYSTNEIINIDFVEFDLNYKHESVHIKFNMGGDFNISNCLAAATVALGDGISLEDIRKGIEGTKPVNGRFQSVDCGQDFSVIVDYAHTPDEIEKLLKTANKIKKNRIITVCGCGGNRDKGKRPIMGKIACDNSDFVIITSDNPRDEEPKSIIEDILEGIKDKNNYRVEVDRADAIKEALSMAKPKDCVIIAGKGHENYQIVKGVKHHFDDKEQVRNYFNAQCTM